MKDLRSRRVLQNTSHLDDSITPTIRIVEGDDGWNTAYYNWINNKTPTNNSEWKRGVWLHFEIISDTKQQIISIDELIKRAEEAQMTRYKETIKDTLKHRVRGLGVLLFFIIVVFVSSLYDLHK